MCTTCTRCTTCAIRTSLTKWCSGLFTRPGQLPAGIVDYQYPVFAGESVKLFGSMRRKGPYRERLAIARVVPPRLYVFNLQRIQVYRHRAAQGQISYVRTMIGCLRCANIIDTSELAPAFRYYGIGGIRNQLVPVARLEQIKTKPHFDHALCIHQGQPVFERVFGVVLLTGTKAGARTAA